MAAQDFLLDLQVQAWLDGLEPAWTLLTFESLQALRHEPAATRTAIRIANDLSCDEIARSPIARNTLILLRAAIAHGGLPLTATGNLTRAVVAKMCTLLAWPDYDQADAFRFSKVINEPDFQPLHVVRQLVLLSGAWDKSRCAMEARILRPLLWFGLLEQRSEKMPNSQVGDRHFYRKAQLFDRLLTFAVQVELSEGIRH